MLSALPSGAVAVVWMVQEDYWPDWIPGAVVTPGEAVPDAQFMVKMCPEDTCGAPYLFGNASLPGGAFLVTWTAAVDNEELVFAQRFASDGTRLYH